MSRTVRNYIKPRLPMEAVLTLRSKGGAQTSTKGARGYDRKQAKAVNHKEISDD